MWDKQINEAQEKYEAAGEGGSYYKLKEGKNRLRILSEGEMMAVHFVGGKGQTCFGKKDGCPHHGAGAPKDEKGNVKRPSMKLVTYVLDKDSKDQKPQLAELPYSVVKAINNFSTEKDFAFSEFPMPYDIVVTKDKKKSASEMYTTFPAATRTAVDPQVLDELERVTPVEKYLERKKERAAKATGAIVDLEENEQDEQ